MTFNACADHLKSGRNRFERQAVEGTAWAPPAMGRDGELPVQNPTRDRDQTGKGKARGRGKDKPGRPDGVGPPDDRGRPEIPGNSGNAPGRQ